MHAIVAALLIAVLSAPAFAEGWTPPPKGEEAYDTMRHLYRELLRFKDDPAFHRDHWLAGTSYASFKMMVDGLDKDQKAILSMMKDCNERNVSAAFCMPSDLGTLGSAYYRSKGKETAETQKWRSQFDAMLGVQQASTEKPVASANEGTIESVRDRIADLESRKSAAAKEDDRTEVRRLVQELKAEKTKLNKLSRKEAGKPLRDTTGDLPHE